MNLLAQRNRRQWMMVVAMVMVAAAIGTGFRFERGKFFSYFCTETFEHFLEYGILPDTQEALSIVTIHLCLRMTIAKVEGTTEQRAWRIALHAIRGLLCRHDPDDSSVVAFEQIAVAKHRSTHGEYSNFFAGGKLRAQAALFAKLEREDQFAADFGSGLNFGMKCKHR